MDDIKPRKRPPTRPRPTATPKPPELALPRPIHPAERPIAEQTAPQPIKPLSSTQPKPKRWGKKYTFITIFALLISAIVIAIGVMYMWYNSNLQPVDSSDETMRVIRVQQGMTTRDIAKALKAQDLIRDEGAFETYVRLEGVSLQAGTYQLSRSDDVSEIAKHIASGKTDTISIMFYPGSTLYEMGTENEAKTSVQTVLQRAGYSDEEIQAAFDKTYDHPLFKDKPASADLEGYIMADTFYFDASATVEDILTHTFDVYYKKIQDENLEAKLKEKGFNLFQGITLASIIQKEVNNKPEQRQVAQVFLKRLDMGMSLGSDPTFIYAARKTGRAEVPTLDSDYNTRIHPGLTPGPIANPSLTALEAITDPADGSYLYFVAGEDGKTYFSMTEAEHNQNIVEHCKSLCQ